MKKWICKNCNYRFDSERASGCPYCGKDSVEKEKDASELLEEIEKLLED